MTDSAPDSTCEILEEGPCKRRLRVLVPFRRVQAELNKNYSELRNRVALPGFRPGRVPRSVLEKRFAKDVEKDVQDELMRSTFGDEVARLSLKLLGPPVFENVQYQSGEAFRFDAVFEVFPNFELPSYKGLSVQAHAVPEVTELDLTAELERISTSAARRQTLSTGEQRDGDLAIADLVFDEGTGMARRSAKDILLKLGIDHVDNSRIEGLSDWLRGAAPGDSRTFDFTTLPESGLSKDSGKQPTLQVTVSSFFRLEPPAIDDDFAQSLGAKSLEDLKARLRDNLGQRGRILEERRQEQELVQQVTEPISMELPDSLLQQIKADQNLEEDLALYKSGKSLDEINAMREANVDLDREVRLALKERFVMERIAELERVFVTEDEVSSRVAAIAQSSGRNGAELLEQYREQGALPAIRQKLMQEKVRRFLRRKAVVQPPEAAPQP